MLIIYIISKHICLLSAMSRNVLFLEKQALKHTICGYQIFDFFVLEPVAFTYHRAPWSVYMVNLMWSQVMEVTAVTT